MQIVMPSCPIFPFPSQLFVPVSFQGTLISPECFISLPPVVLTFGRVSPVSPQVAFGTSDPGWTCQMSAKCLIPLSSPSVMQG